MSAMCALVTKVRAFPTFYYICDRGASLRVIVLSYEGELMTRVCCSKFVSAYAGEALAEQRSLKISVSRPLEDRSSKDYKSVVVWKLADDVSL